MKCTDADLVAAGAALLRLDYDNSSEAAQRIFEAALEINPDNQHASHNLGTMLSRSGKPQEALPRLAHAVALNPKAGLTWGELATAYRDLRDFGAALLCSMHAVELCPSPKLWYQLAGLNEMLGKYDASEVCYKNSLRLSPEPETSYAWGMNKMLKKDFSFGLPLYEERLQVPAIQPNKVNNVLDIIGSPAESIKKVIVMHEQGIGDLFQMSRYGPLLQRHFGNAEIILVCSAGLVPLMSRLSGFHKVTAEIEYQDLPDTVVMSAMSLMYWAILSGYDIYQPCAEVNLLTLPRIPLIDSTMPRIGICWAGNPNHKLDRYRSIPIDVFGTLIGEFSKQNKPRRMGSVIQCGGFMFYSLQYDAEYENRFVADWESTMATLSNLDLVITCDTAVAHLAGTLGKPTWLLVSANPDWRWGLESETTPWYRNMILFRQQELLNWVPVIESVRAKLKTVYGG